MTGESAAPVGGGQVPGAKGPPPPLVLASASPRRAGLLTQLGLTFQVDPSHIPEGLLPGEPPEAHARRLSREKAEEVRGRHPEALVLAGDTVVVLEGEILGKPETEARAEEMLMALSGRSHTVVSGLALAFPGDGIRDGALTAQVTFRAFPRDVARAYVSTGEPMDKAGAYGIQGLGGALVEGIRGDYHTVVGLPIPLFIRILRDGGWRYEFGIIRPYPSQEDP